MSVKLYVPSYMRFLTDNNDTIMVEGSTVGECLKDLVRRYPDLEPLVFPKGMTSTYNFEIYVNMISIKPEGLDKQVKDGDEIAVIATLTGG